jgi:hypothetical protein
MEGLTDRSTVYPAIRGKLPCPHRTDLPFDWHAFSAMLICAFGTKHCIPDAPKSSRSVTAATIWENSFTALLETRPPKRLQ